MKSYVLFAASLTMAVAAGCGDAGSGRAVADAHAHTHAEKLPLTAYADGLEVYAEASPFVVGEAGSVLAHLTVLQDFKPLRGGRVVASLVVDGDSVAQSLDDAASPGVYRFSLTPRKSGRGRLAFDIWGAAGRSRVVVQDVAVHQDHHAAHCAAASAVMPSSNGVAFPKEVSWKTDFSTDSCRNEPFGEVFRTMAQVLPAQSADVLVVARAGGIVSLPEGGLVVGQEVAAGRELMAIGGDEMAGDNLGVRLREAESNLSLAQKEYERKRLLAKDKIVAESELLRAKADYEIAVAAYDNLRKNFAAGRLSLIAPISGFVSRLMVGNGEFVEAGQPVAAISQSRDIILRAEVQPGYYPLLKDIAGAKIRKLNSSVVYDLGDMDGRLVSYGKSVDVASPLVPVVFQLQNVADLLPGTFVELYVRTRGGRPALTVPSVSIVEEMGNYFVYVQLTPEFFEKREVKIGRADGERTEIVEGLTGAERVVGKGAVLVKLAQSMGTLDAHSGHVH